MPATQQSRRFTLVITIPHGIASFPALPKDIPSPLPVKRAANVYFAKFLFENCHGLQFVASHLLPNVARKVVPVLALLWPLVLLVIPTFESWAYLTVGWAVLHAARPTDGAYAVSAVSAVSAMRTGAIGGAILGAAAGVLFVLQFVMHAATYVPGLDDEDKEEDDKKPAAAFYVLSAVLTAPVYGASAAVGAAVGAAVMRDAQLPRMNVLHAVRAGIVGGVILSVPSNLWCLFCAYKVIRAYVRAALPT